MALAEYKVEGLREFLAATRAAGKEVDTAVRKALKEAAEPVRQEWSELLWDYESATGLRVSVKSKGTIAVEQGHPKVTGLRGDYGGYQMRRGVRALADKQSETERQFEVALDHIIDVFER